ncbi:30S ribosomal protein S1 [Enterobacteriaceae endosymbiont of Macroplea appendiculata]|uniref:30S ribosomal protein S1 n=1 Tax=Enterobacteriaceae endosymbiont of Macroplea appendiculata TaxID=2675790 RepID=UPI001449AEAD|nr:30S ribosomal protein S1 [Enterobacteriaceae endosymbiont of Macroplea appendiculata]QJC30897.1 30S ribosomal protein S1 [Enterobacteriaceae endosymbiont of Macroplea appendiculata]
MVESFTQLFEKTIKKQITNIGSIVKGTVISIKKDIVLVDAGFKSESSIPIEQFKNNQGLLEIKQGDTIDVALDAIEDGFGETILSREKAKRYESWMLLEKAQLGKTNINGIINGKVKGGFTVDLNGIRAFLPGSLVDIRPIKDSFHLEGKELEFKVIKLDQKRNNVVVSRKAVIESEHSAEREQLLNSLNEGLKIKGLVKNLTDYGAFVDLGGVDGLLHITDMSWKRVKHPSEIVSIGEEIFVKILKFDKEKTRVSLGLKQLGEDPWISISKRYPINTKLTGKVTNLTDYGCFVEIENGIEGLVHISEMDWTNKNIHPTKKVQVNHHVEVMVLDIDEERRRISLGIKQCTVNPWLSFAKKHHKGEKVQGKIKSITDFGIFIGLEGGIDGLVHISDLSWEQNSEEVVKQYKKGDNISAIVLQVDSERERISLGIKQLQDDPLDLYYKKLKQNNIVIGKIIVIKNKTVTIQLSNNILGYVKFSDHDNYSNQHIQKYFKIGENIEGKINSIDKKNRVVHIKLRLKDIESSVKHNINNKQTEKFTNVMTEAFKAAKCE